MNDIYHLLVILILSTVFGMLVGLLIRERDHYHGPNAKKYIEPTYYSKKLGKCIKFSIKLINCKKN